MGVTGLYAYLNNRAPGCAQACTLRRADDGPRDDSDPPRRIVLIDANGLYHHLMYKYCASAPRSLGGEWGEFAAATRRFIGHFLALGCRVCAVFDGCASSRESKSATRAQRARDRRAKMRRFNAELRARMEGESGSAGPAGLPLPSACVSVEPRDESLLPVPAASLLSLVQLFHTMGVSCWNSDGENDEHLAAIAVHLASSAPRGVAVDVLGQDSDFLVFDTRVDGRDDADACGYVPLDSLRFDVEEVALESDDHAGGRSGGAASVALVTSSISFKRYTTASVCEALHLSPCLLPSLACLVGNDSDIDLLHFHCFTHSAAFTRMLRDSMGGNGRPGALGKAGSRNTNASSVDSNGGFNTGTQLVEAVLAFLQSVSRSSSAALSACHGAAGASQQQQQAHVVAMQSVIQRIFGDDALAQRAPSGAAGAAGPCPSPCPPAPSSALQSFRAAQLKYSLTRFFQAQEVAASVASQFPRGWGVFDAAFEAETGVADAAPHAVPDSRMEDEDALSSSPSPSLSLAAAAPSPPVSTTVLLPLPLLRLYRSALLSPVLLSIVLTRQWVSHVAVGDVLHPCVFHTQRTDADTEVDAEESLCHRAAWEHESRSASDVCRCVSASECVAGVRLRVYQLLLCDIDVRPRSIPRPDSAATPPAGRAVSALVSSLVGSVTSLFRSAQPAAAGAAGAAAAAAAATAQHIPAPVDMAIAEHIQSASGGAHGGDSERWVHVEVRHSDALALRQGVAAALASSSSSSTRRVLPSLFPELDHSSADSVARGARVEEEWMHLLALLDVAPDLQAYHSAKLAPLPARLSALRHALAPLAHSFPRLTTLSLVFRQVFLHSTRALLSRRFDPPAIGASIDGAVRAQIRRAVIGLNAMLVQCAILVGQTDFHDDNDDGEDAHDSEEVAVPAPPSYLSVEGVSLAQLFAECYHWSEYALQAIRCRSHMQVEHERTVTNGGSTFAAGWSDSTPSSESAPPHALALLPLSRSFQGSLFHRVYVELLAGMEAADALKGGDKKKKKRKQAPAAAAASATSSGHPLGTGASSSSRPTQTAAPASTWLFSSALANALLDVDESLHDQAMALMQRLAVQADRRPTQQWTRVSAVYLSLKTCVWSSIGLPVPSSWVAHASSVPTPAAAAAAVGGDDARMHASERAMSSPLARPCLPYESWVEVADDRAPTPASRLSSPPANFFSLCCAPNSACVDGAGTDAAALHPASTCSCGVRPVHVPMPADEGGDDEAAADSASDGEGERTATSPGWSTSKGKRKKKSKGRGKR